MYYRFIYTFVLLIGISLPRFSFSEELPAKILVHFSGKSTLHDFAGQVTTLPFDLHLEEATDHQPESFSAEALFNVSDMDTQSAKRDKKMRKMFDESNFPQVKASIENIETPTGDSATIPLQVTIHGTTQTIQANVVDWQDDQKTLSTKLAFDVSLTSFELKPPSVLGLINVSDTVHVECDITATHANN